MARLADFVLILLRMDCPLCSCEWVHAHGKGERPEVLPCPECGYECRVPPKDGF